MTLSELFKNSPLITNVEYQYHNVLCIMAYNIRIHYQNLLTYNR